MAAPRWSGFLFPPSRSGTGYLEESRRFPYARQSQTPTDSHP